MARLGELPSISSGALAHLPTVLVPGAQAGPRQALTRASTNRPLKASSLPGPGVPLGQVAIIAAVSFSAVVPGGRHPHLSWGQMQRPRVSRERAALKPAARKPSGLSRCRENLTAALGRQGLLLLTWGLLDQGVGEAVLARALAAAARKRLKGDN